MDEYSEETTFSRLFCLPLEKGSTLKGKSLLSMKANSFLLRREFVGRKEIRKSQKLSLLLRVA